MACVYCYQLGSNCYKVGRTKNSPGDRKRGFATGSPVKPKLYREIPTDHASGLERYIHQLLDEKRAENGEIFYVTSQELDDAVDKAVAFVEESQPVCREAAKLRRRKPASDTMLEPSSEMLGIYRQIRTLCREKYLIDQQIVFLESKIQVAIRDNSGMMGVASWKWEDRWTMDTVLFKKEQQGLYDAYKRNSGGRKFQLERVDLTKANSAKASQIRIA
ncbi:MAG: GIY-YIG nuclease family protein [Candidatus Sulfotelmatobacter sp.]